MQLNLPYLFNKLKLLRPYHYNLYLLDYSEKSIVFYLLLRNKYGLIIILNFNRLATT